MRGIARDEEDDPDAEEDAALTLRAVCPTGNTVEGAYRKSRSREDERASKGPKVAGQDDRSSCLTRTEAESERGGGDVVIDSEVFGSESKSNRISSEVFCGEILVVGEIDEGACERIRDEDACGVEGGGGGDKGVDDWARASAATLRRVLTPVGPLGSRGAG